MPDGMRTILWLLASEVLSFLFVCVSVRDVRRTTPAQFWPWLKVRAEDLTDMRAYNRENCSMWMSCAFCFFANGLIGLFSRQLSMAFYTFFLFPGFWLLSRRYNRVLRRYLKRGAGDEASDGCPD